MDFTKTIKTLKLFLATVLVGTASLSANADTFYDEASGLYFETSDDGTCSVAHIIGVAYSNDSYIIPSVVTYNETEYSVTSIGDRAFYQRTKLSSITIPESVTSIGNYAFYECSSLTSINIQKGVTAIGNFAFNRCTSLTSVNIPESVVSIGNFAFSECSLLTSVNILDGVKSIGTDAFSKCPLLSSIIIPKSITSIAEYTFYGCSSLTSIEIPNNVTMIGPYAFSSCTALTSVTLSENLIYIQKYAFSNCTSLKGIYTNKFTGEYQNVLIIPKSVKIIDSDAFKNCTSLENVWIGDDCYRIGEEAFSGDTGLITISSRNEVAPSLKYKNTFSDETYETATLYIRDGEDVWNSYIDDSVNYWYLFLNRDNSTYGTDDGGIQVGVGEVETDDIAVTTDGKAIEVTGYEGEVSVYNVAGMRVYQGYDSRIELTNPGIYVVIVNGKSYKVAIK